MIYSNITVTISGGQSKINEKIILFRGDRDVQVSFEIIQSSFKFAKGENVINAKEAGYGQLIIEKPDQSHVFSEITECENGRVIFTITADMIDELNEVGSYAIQIRLFDSTASSRITLPSISNAIEVHQPMASEDLSDVATVGTASIDYAVINDEGEQEDFFYDDNTYKITYWYTGDKITAGRMNKIEGAIYEINDKIENVEIPTKVSDLENDKGYLTEHQPLTDYATKAEIPTKVSDLENDKGYLTEHQPLTDYATKSYVGEEIAKAQLEGEDVDLSSYATKAEIPTNISQLTNDSGYLTGIPSEYVTDTELNAKGYLTGIPSEYVTDSELNAKGYLTEHQSLTDYATKSYVDEAINALRTELMDLINSGGGPIDLSEIFPISNTYLYPDGRAYEDAKGRGMLNIPLRNYTDFYITATALYSATILCIYDVTGKSLGYKGNNTTEGVTWVEEHIVVSDLLEEYPNAYYISLSSYSRDAATTSLVVTAIPV